MSIEKIKESLLSDEEDSNFNLEEKKEIAGIIYGVSPEKGLEILLGKEIAKYWGEDLNDFIKQFIIKQICTRLTTKTSHLHERLVLKKHQTFFFVD